MTRAFAGTFEPTAADDLLRWASEAGTGRWDQLAGASAHLVRRDDLGRLVRPWWLASNLDQLGHLDIDWEARRWSVAQPALVLPEGTGLCAYLAGSRPEMLLHRFEHAVSEDGIYSAYHFTVQQALAPTSHFVKAASVDHLAAVAEMLDVPLLIDPATNLAKEILCPSLEALERASPLDPADDLKWWDPSVQEWKTVEAHVPDGLIEIDLHGRAQHYWKEADLWYGIDLGTGYILASRKSGLEPLRWVGPNARVTKPARLEVTGIELPQLATRALIASSGLLPARPTTRPGTKLFANVSRAAANRVATRLELPLRT